MEITSQADKAPLLRDLPSRLLGQTAALVSRVAADTLAAEGAHRNQFAVLATLDAFQQKLERQGRLAHAGICLNEIKTVSRHAACQDFIKAFHAHGATWI